MCSCKAAMAYEKLYMDVPLSESTFDSLFIAENYKEKTKNEPISR